MCHRYSALQMVLLYIGIWNQAFKLICRETSGLPQPKRLDDITRNPGRSCNRHANFILYATVVESVRILFAKEIFAAL